MTSRYLILRQSADKLATFGPSAETFDTESAADTEARTMVSRSPGETIVIAQVIAEYTQEPSVVVRRVA